MDRLIYDNFRVIGCHGCDSVAKDFGTFLVRPTGEDIMEKVCSRT